MADEHLEYFKKKVLEYGFMLFFNILEPGVKSTKNIQIEGVHIEYFCSMLQCCLKEKLAKSDHISQ